MIIGTLGAFMGQGGAVVDPIPSGLLADTLAWWDGRYANLSDVTIWEDHSSNNRNLTLNNFAGTAASGWNESPDSLQTDGVNDYGLLTESNFIASGTSFSVFAIFKIADLTGNKFVCSLYADTTHYFNVYLSTKVNFEGVDNAGGYVSKSSVNAISAGTWFSVGFVYNATTKKIKIYLNGVYESESNAFLQNFSAMNYAALGKPNDTRYCVLRTGIFALLTKALSDIEVEELYNTNCEYFGLTKI